MRSPSSLSLEYDSNTLPVLDHYLRTVPEDQPAAIELVVATSGAYFGEVVRQLLGGRWDLTGETAGAGDGAGGGSGAPVEPGGILRLADAQPLPTAPRCRIWLSAA